MYVYVDVDKLMHAFLEQFQLTFREEIPPALHTTLPNKNYQISLWPVRVWLPE